MIYYIYVLYSPLLDSFYKGQTSDISERLKRHNAGYEISTRKGKPWKLVWYTEKDTRSEALKLESNLKNLSRSRLVEFIMKYGKDIVDKELMSRFER